ncbi:MAG: preprotein translocase subunit SecE [Lachnospiraceae bacterium]|nr:preprotein translocase subunit SecE [Lachnospiraceae bacterium]MCR5086884.1 preprotein translocase subunit SecE [Lachnospiraceae bacterium]
MSETNTTAKTSHWKNLKAEWKKIIWPSRDTLVKESAAVVVITVILGVVIKLIDFGLDKLLGLIL